MVLLDGGDGVDVSRPVSARAGGVCCACRATAATMQQQTEYTDVTLEVMQYFAEKIAKARALGIVDIVIDPGFGFAKTTAQNFTLLQNLNLFKSIDVPILVGLSLISSALAAANYTGGALNPARVLGSIAVLGCDEKARSSAVFYVTGEIVGAIIAPVAIIPWFGICQNSWYREYIPKVLSNMYIKSLKHFLLPDIESESTSTSIE